MTPAPEKEYIITEERLQELVYADVRTDIKEEWADEVRSRPYTSASSDKVLKQVKEHLDDVIAGELPCGEDERSLSTYCAIRTLIEQLEKGRQQTKEREQG